VLTRVEFRECRVYLGRRRLGRALESIHLRQEVAHLTAHPNHDPGAEEHCGEKRLA
jgi:hypothetical protein